MNHKYSIKWSSCIFVFLKILVSVLQINILFLFLSDILLFHSAFKKIFSFVLLTFPCIYLIIFLHNFRKRLTWVKNKPLPGLICRRKLLIEIQACIRDISHFFCVPILLLLLWVVVTIIYFIVGVISFMLIHSLFSSMLLLSLSLLGIL